MLFKNYGRLLAASTVFLTTAFAAAGKKVDTPLKNCEDLKFADFKSWGESTGSTFCASHLVDGLMIKKIETWSWLYHGRQETEGMRGLRVTYSDESFTEIGDLSDKDGDGQDRIYSVLEWDPQKDTVEWLTAYDSIDDDQFVNGFRMMMTNGEMLCGGFAKQDSLDRCYADKTPPKDARDVIKGTLLGVSGQVGNPNNFLNIERISFHVLNMKVLQSDEVIDVTLSPTIEELNKMEDKKSRGGISNRTISVYHFINQSNDTVDFTAGQKAKVGYSRTSSVSKSEMEHLGWDTRATLEVQVPQIASVKVETGFQYQWEGTKTKLTQDVKDEELETTSGPRNVPVQPQAAKKVACWSITGEYNINWTGRRKIKLNGGGEFSVPVSGQIKGVQYSEAVWDVQDETVEEARKGIINGEGDGSKLESPPDENDLEIDPPAQKKAKRFIA